MAQACPARPIASLGLLGTTIGETGTHTLPLARWQTLAVVNRRLVPQPAMRRARRLEGSRWVFCDLPVGETITLAWDDDAAAHPIAMLREEAPRVLALQLHPAAAPPAARRGRVVHDGQGVVEAEVRVVGRDGIIARTGADGGFVLDGAPSGSLVLAVRAIGFEPITVSLGADPLEIVLTPSAQRLADLTTEETARTVSPMLAGYERRRAQGLGRFVDRADIERRKPLTASDVLRDLPGVQLVNGGLGVSVLRNRRGVKLAPDGTPKACFFALYVDGQKRTADPASVDQLAVQDIEGMELHQAATIPPELVGYQTDDECGAVLVWTRRGLARR